MRFPGRYVTGNLIWSVDGGVWALWRAAPIAYAYAPTADKLAAHREVAATLTGLTGETLLLSVVRRVDPAAVAARMQDATPAGPAWQRRVDAAVAELTAEPAYERLLYVACRLPDGGLSDRLVAGLDTAAGWFAGRLGLPPTPPSGEQVERRRHQADQLQARLGAGMGLRPATAGEVQWLYARAALRPVAEPAWPSDGGRGGLRLTHLVDAVFCEGGDATDAHRPRHRRYLRVESAQGVGYQTFLVASDMPRQWEFPGGTGEWFLAADQAPFPVDWAARISPVANAAAQQASRRQARQLVSQVAEYDGKPAGPPPQLAEAMHLPVAAVGGAGRT